MGVAATSVVAFNRRLRVLVGRGLDRETLFVSSMTTRAGHAKDLAVQSWRVASDVAAAREEELV